MFSQKTRIRYLLLFSLFLTPLLSHPSSPDGKKESFDAGKMILDHIYDSHDWHLFDWRGHSVSIPLPVILFCPENGIQIFMSSKFNHGHTPHKNYVLITDSNKRDYIAEDKKEEKELQTGKIYYIKKEEGGAVKIDMTKSASIWDFSITKNVVSLFFSVFLLLFIFISISKKYKKNKGSSPSGIQSFLEPLVIFVRDDIAKTAIGEKHYKKHLPFLLTVFFFIFLNNLLGLIPFFPGGANLTGNIAVPMVMASMVFVITTLSGKKHYWQHIFMMPGVPKPVLLILTPIEIIGVFLKPLVLMIRLFANITAGHIIILSFFSLIFIFGEMHYLAGYGVSILSGLFVLFMMTLELLVALLQAYVFTLLSAIYFGMALEEH